MTACIQGAPFKLLTRTYKRKLIYRMLLPVDAPAPTAVTDFLGHVISRFTGLNSLFTSRCGPRDVLNTVVYITA